MFSEIRMSVDGETVVDWSQDFVHPLDVLYRRIQLRVYEQNPQQDLTIGLGVLHIPELGFDVLGLPPLITNPF